MISKVFYLNWLSIVSAMTKEDGQASSARLMRIPQPRTKHSTPAQTTMKTNRNFFKTTIAAVRKNRKNLPVILHRAALAGLLFAASLLPAQATDYTYSFSLDLSSRSVIPQGANEFDLFSFPGGQPNFMLNDGDKISGTITFANNQRIQITDPTGTSLEYMSLAFSPQGSSHSEVNTSITLLGVSGSLTGANPQNGSNSGNTVIGATFFGMTPSQMSFSGFDYSITLRPGNTGNNVYQASSLQIYAAANNVTVVSPVPEPSALALAGLGGVGLLLALRRVKVSGLK